MRVEILEVMREIFNSQSIEIAREMTWKTVERYQKKALGFAKWLEGNIEKGLTQRNRGRKYEPLMV